MTDLDAAAYIRELIDYNNQGLLKTPQNNSVDTFWTCAFEHAIRALEKCSGLTDVVYKKNPNGSFTAIIQR